jgi:acid phosphatase family membrane protein YuiD
MNKIAIASLASGLIAQAIKTFIEFVRTGALHLPTMFYTGGMPSSHTALVTTLTIGVGLQSGISSSLFSVTLIFSLYFIFEATGLRQEVGKQAKVLNELVDELLARRHFNRRRLKELVGHTWGEVFVGLLIGVAVALLSYT